jgi:heptosyltransferase-3
LLANEWLNQPPTEFKMLRRNVLIFHSGALGDFVLSWPLALALGRIYAQSRIIYVTASQKGALAERALRVDSTDSEAGWHQLFSTGSAPSANVLRLLEGAHAIFSFVADDQSLWAINVRHLAPHAKLFYINLNPPERLVQQASTLLLDQLGVDPVVGTAVGQMLKSIQDRGVGTSRPAAGPIVLHPGAGAQDKRWPVECFVSLARKLNEAGHEVIVVLGEVELERWSQTEQALFDGVASLNRPATLVDLLGVISGASVFVGNDSGPAHLAGIIGVPTIALFGPTDPAIWKPIGPRVRVIQNNSIEAITVDQVFDAVIE